jgi:hypothetical protein
MRRYFVRRWTLQGHYPYQNTRATVANRHVTLPELGAYRYYYPTQHGIYIIYPLDGFPRTPPVRPRAQVACVTASRAGHLGALALVAASGPSGQRGILPEYVASISPTVAPSVATAVPTLVFVRNFRDLRAKCESLASPKVLAFPTVFERIFGKILTKSMYLRDCKADRRFWPVT